MAERPFSTVSPTCQYGRKLGELDYGVGNDLVAIRVALINQTYGGYRVFIGGPMQGEYIQLAVRPIKNTVIRLTFDQQVFDRPLRRRHHSDHRKQC